MTDLAMPDFEAADVEEFTEDGLARQFRESKRVIGAAQVETARLKTVILAHENRLKEIQAEQSERVRRHNADKKVRLMPLLKFLVRDWRKGTMSEQDVNQRVEQIAERIGYDQPSKDAPPVDTAA